MSTWWRNGMDVGLALTAVGYRWAKEKGSDKFPYIEGWPEKVTMDLNGLDLDDHDCLEEQIWAMQVGLTD